MYGHAGQLMSLNGHTVACRNLRIPIITGGQAGADLTRASQEEIGRMQQALLSTGGPTLSTVQLHSMRERLLVDLAQKAQGLQQPVLAGQL